MRRRLARTAVGQGIIEGTIGLVILVGAGLLTTAFIFNCGAGVLYKSKLSMVTMQTARWASTVTPNANLQSETTNFVQQLLPSVGITPSNLSVTTQSTTSNGQSGATVTISNQFPIFGAGFFVPARVQMSDTEFAGVPQS